MYAVKAEVDLSASTVMINCALLVTGSGGQLARICSRGAKDEARNGSPTAEGQLENRCASLPRLLLLPFLALLNLSFAPSQRGQIVKSLSDLVSSLALACAGAN